MSSNFIPSEIPVTIIGAGQAGLAMSRCLTDRGIEHVVLERGQVANSWRSERWDSLRLLTPNWMTRLPGYQYTGNDPDGYMTAAEVSGFLSGYQASFSAPVQDTTTVLDVATIDSGFCITTTQGQWRSRSVVVATGACGTPRIPALASALPSNIHQLAPIHYRNPEQLDGGPVLVVGASASGAQIADELSRNGNDVTIAVGDHVRLPRQYRGRNIHWWMDAIGLLDEGHDEVPDITRARRLPSLQLVGSPDQRNLDLNSLHAAGVGIVGRLAGVNGTTAQFSGSLANQCQSADLKLGRLLERIDEFATETGLDAELPEADRPAPTEIPTGATTLDVSNVKTVIWATGFRPDFPWLESDLLDRKGAIAHEGGIMNRPGMFVLGMPFTRRRKSSFLDGVGPDAEVLAGALHTHLDQACVLAR